MEEHEPAYSQQIAQEEWEKTPASVKQMVEQMAKRLSHFVAAIREGTLTDGVNQEDCGSSSNRSHQRHTLNCVC